MRRTPSFWRPRLVDFTIAGWPSRASTHRRIRSWSVVFFEEARVWRVSRVADFAGRERLERLATERVGREMVLLELLRWLLDIPPLRLELTEFCDRVLIDKKFRGAAAILNRGVRLPL